MKALLLERAPGDAITCPMGLEVVPGSAIVPCRKPLFLPLMAAQSWEGVPGLALRLVRLGKSIDKRFAPRYYDAVAPVVVMRSPELMEWPGYGAALDGSMLLGQWQPLADSYTLAWADDPASAVIVSSEALGADDAVAALSAVMTLQMGDILVASLVPELTRPVAKVTALDIILNGALAITGKAH